MRINHLSPRSLSAKILVRPLWLIAILCAAVPLQAGEAVLSTDFSREPAYKLLQVIIDKAKAAGGMPGNPEAVIPRPGEEIKDAVQRILRKGSHMTIE